MTTSGPIAGWAAGYEPFEMDDGEDDDRRETAAHIEWQKQGMWLVLWGSYTRRYWAFACWPVPQGGAVASAVDPDALYAEMRRIEREFGFLRWRYGGG